MQEMVAGFAFSKDLSEVILIRKAKPKWQAQKLNGVGGKVEENEHPDQAMTREFGEEAGVYGLIWRKFATLSDINAEQKVHFYYYLQSGDELSTIRHKQEAPGGETIEYGFVEYIHEYSDIVPNLLWLIPMALQAVQGTITWVSQIVEDRVWE